MGEIDIFLLSASEVNEFRERASRRGATLALAQFGTEWVAAMPPGPNRSGRISAHDPARLRLVVQKGRLFNAEHPEVPVVVDRGRYQIVEIDPEHAKSIAGDHCY